ncbi:MAG: hypothetical protein K2P19_12510, partial [Kineothrix sp.]|nr:hypothetical protein [Kineothrix sp.]
AELADAHGSGPCGSNTMRVQVSFPALNTNLGIPAKWNSGVIYYYLSLTAVLGKKNQPGGQFQRMLRILSWRLTTL